MDPTNRSHPISSPRESRPHIKEPCSALMSQPWPLPSIFTCLYLYKCIYISTYIYVQICIYVSFYIYRPLILLPKSKIFVHLYAWMSRVTYEWVTLHMYAPYHVWMTHVTYEWLMSHTNESWITTLHRDASVSLFDTSRNSLIYQMKHSRVSRVNMPCGIRIDLCDMTHVLHMRPTAAATRVPGLGQITWWIVMTKKIEGPFGGKNCTEIKK